MQTRHSSINMPFHVLLLGLVALSSVNPTAAQYKLEQQRIPVHDLLKLTLADWGSYSHRDHKGPGTYAYGYDIEDPYTGNIQFKQEERHLNGTVTGSYGYVEPDGNARVMHYISDHLGYRVTTSDPHQKLTTLLGTPLNDIAAQDKLVEAPPAPPPPSLVQLPPIQDDPRPPQPHPTNKMQGAASPPTYAYAGQFPPAQIVRVPLVYTRQGVPLHYANNVPYGPYDNTIYK